jgi:hypothetical protein
MNRETLLGGGCLKSKDKLHGSCPERVAWVVHLCPGGAGERHLSEQAADGLDECI